MSGVRQVAVRAISVLICDARDCHARWSSETYAAGFWGSDVEGAAPAWDLGWRVYAGAREQRTYCPEHAPTRTMRLVHGR